MERWEKTYKALDKIAWPRYVLPTMSRLDPDGSQIDRIAIAVCEKLGEARPSRAAFARFLGVERSTVQEYERLPLKYVPKVSALTGISMEELRPDVYRVEAAE